MVEKSIGDEERDPRVSFPMDVESVVDSKVRKYY
jgi:hypothetical protein